MTTRPPAQSWYETLPDSAYALGAAAREARTAYRAAQTNADHYDLLRVRPVPGEVTVPGRIDPLRPHDQVLMHLHAVAGEQLSAMRRVWTSAAVAYAYGVTRAVRQVLDGHEPPEIAADGSDGRWGVVINQLPEIDSGLTRYAHRRVVAAARAAMTQCLTAGDHAEDIADQEYVSDHEAGELLDALDIAEGLPDAAYAYGVAAEGALHCVLNARRAART